MSVYPSAYSTTVRLQRFRALSVINWLVMFLIIVILYCQKRLPTDALKILDLYPHYMDLTEEIIQAKNCH